MDLQERVGPRVTLLSDPAGDAVAAFGMRDEIGIPKMILARSGTFLIDRDGIVRNFWLGGSYRERVDPAEVLGELR